MCMTLKTSRGRHLASFRFQIRDEINFHRELLWKTLLAAQREIESDLATMMHEFDENGHIQILEAGYKEVTEVLRRHRKQKKTASNKTQNWWQKVFSLKSESEELRIINRFDAELNRILYSLLEVRQVFSTLSDQRQMLGEFQRIRDTYEHAKLSISDFSVTGKVAVSLSERIDVGRLSLSFSKNIFTKHGSWTIYAYNLDDIDETYAARGRSRMAEICRAPINIDLSSGYMREICLLYNLARSISMVDKDLLDGVQISWAATFANIKEQWERKQQEKRVRIAISVNDDRSRGTPVPRYVPESSHKPG